MCLKDILNRFPNVGPHKYKTIKILQTMQDQESNDKIMAFFKILFSLKDCSNSMFLASAIIHKNFINK